MFSQFKTQLESVLFHIQNMEIDKASEFFDENREFEYFSKLIFFANLKNMVELFSQNGDTFLNINSGQCGDCECHNESGNGYRFIGNQTGNYMDFIFEMEGENVVAFYDCPSFNVSGDSPQNGKRFSFKWWDIGHLNDAPF